MRQLLSLSILFLACFAGCKPKEPDPNKDILLRHQWRYDAMWVNDVQQPLSGCAQDNFQSFYADGGAVLDEGATKCDSSAVQATPETWTMSEDQKTLIVISNGVTISYAHIVIDD